MNARVDAGRRSIESQFGDAHCSLSYMEPHLLRIFAAVEALANEANSCMRQLASKMASEPSADGRWENIEGPRNEALDHVRQLTDGLESFKRDLVAIENAVREKGGAE